MDLKVKISLICSLLVLFSLTFASNVSEISYPLYVIYYIAVYSVPFFAIRKIDNNSGRLPKSSVINKIYLSALFLSANFLFSIILTNIFNDSNVASYSFDIKTLIFTGILIPILEEIFWRGTVAYGLSSAGAITASVISSVMFGLLHSGISGIIYGVFAGLLFSILFLSTGSLIPGIVIHMINNVTAIVSIKYPFIVIPVCCISAVTAVIFYFISKNKEQHKVNVNNTSNTNVLSEPLFYISIIIFMLYRYLFI